MELATLMAIYPIARELASKTPQIRKWLEKKAKEEDASVFLQLQAIEEIRILRSYSTKAPILSALLSNPDLSEEEVNKAIRKTRKIVREIAEMAQEFKDTSP